MFHTDSEKFSHASSALNVLLADRCALSLALPLHIGHYALVAAKDYGELFSRLAGRPLIQFCVGSGVRLDLAGSPHYEITIESPLSIAAANLERAESTSVEVLAVLRGLLMQPVRSVVEYDGQLSVVFDSMTITVPRDDDYEAWQIRADDGMMIVCIPGGELAVWLPE